MQRFVLVLLCSHFAKRFSESSTSVPKKAQLQRKLCAKKKIEQTSHQLYWGDGQATDRQSAQWARESATSVTLILSGKTTLINTLLIAVVSINKAAPSPLPLTNGRLLRRKGELGLCGFWHTT
jgi:hypothetical protein